MFHERTMLLKSPAQSRARNREKLLLLFRFLAEWHFITADAVARLFHVLPHPSLYTWLDGLVARGLLSRLDGVFGMPKLRVYSGGPGARAAFPSLFAMAFVPTPQLLARRAAQASFHHELAVRHFIVAHPCAHGWRRSSSVPGGIVPDALVGRGESAIAVEIELHQKNAGRMYRSFGAHADAMAKGEYGYVRWVFPHESIRDSYQARFDELEWPQFWFDAERRQYRATGQRMRVDSAHPLRNHVTFEVHKLWPEIKTNF